MVSDWMVNGNINDFVKAHPDANRLELVGISLSLIAPVSKFVDDRMAYPAGRRC